MACAAILRFERLRKTGLVYPVRKKEGQRDGSVTEPPAAKPDDPSSSLRTHVAEEDS